MSPQSQKPDYYELLQVERTAAEADIKRAYRKLARQYHPDVNRDDPQAEELFKQISEAYAVLSDPDRRAQYDRVGHGAPGDFGFGGVPDIFSIFSSVFGGDAFGFDGFAHRREAVGRSLLYEAEVSLEDVLHGLDKEIQYTRLAACEACEGTGAAPGTKPNTCLTCGGVGRVRTSRNTFLGSIATVQDCPACHGTGEVIEEPCGECHGQAVTRREETVTVRIPPGVNTGDELVLRGFGEAPIGGGHTGDLHVRMRVLPHDHFVRRGDDLHLDLPISFSQAALGDAVTTEGLDGAVELTVPAGVQSGEQITTPGRGLPRPRSSHRGDLVAHLRLVTPSHLTPRQRELFLELAAEGDEHVTPGDKGFFSRLREAITGQ